MKWLRTFLCPGGAMGIQSYAVLLASLLSTPSAPKVSCASFAILAMPSPKPSWTNRNGSSSIHWMRLQCCLPCFFFCERGVEISQMISRMWCVSCLLPSRTGWNVLGSQAFHAELSWCWSLWSDSALAAYSRHRCFIWIYKNHTKLHTLWDLWFLTCATKNSKTY